jgi:hypothetical protein
MKRAAVPPGSDQRDAKRANRGGLVGATEIAQNIPVFNQDGR